MCEASEVCRRCVTYKGCEVSKRCVRCERCVRGKGCEVYKRCVRCARCARCVRCVRGESQTLALRRPGAPRRLAGISSSV